MYMYIYIYVYVYIYIYIYMLQDCSSVGIGFSMNKKCHILPVVYNTLV